MIISEQKARPELSKTPDAIPPVYYPTTIHGKTGVFGEEEYKQMVSRSPGGKDPVPSVA